MVLARYMLIYMWVLHDHDQCTSGVAHEQLPAFRLPASLVIRQVTQVSSPCYFPAAGNNWQATSHCVFIAI